MSTSENNSSCSYLSPHSPLPVQLLLLHGLSLFSCVFVTLASPSCLPRSILPVLSLFCCHTPNSFTRVSHHTPLLTGVATPYLHRHAQPASSVLLFCALLSCLLSPSVVSIDQSIGPLRSKMHRLSWYSCSLCHHLYCSRVLHFTSYSLDGVSFLLPHSPGIAPSGAVPVLLLLALCRTTSHKSVSRFVRTLINQLKLNPKHSTSCGLQSIDIYTLVDRIPTNNNQK
jgi:hypothetical protein